jgi:XTP/dITP diphosphohydrolase
MHSPTVHTPTAHSLDGNRIVVASHNEGKLREFADLMAPFGFEAKSAKEYGLPEPDETGTTFEENAYIKAFAAAEATGLPALSDDSGLCVDALDGAPGVYTANWAETPDGSRDFGMAMQRTEVALQDVGAIDPAQRKGRFVAVICLAFPDGAAEYFRGEVEGTLVWPPRGELGFGYDPVFLPNGFEKTFGEMNAEEKHGWKPGQPEALSHRARAFQKFAEARLDLARLGSK